MPLVLASLLIGALAGPLAHHVAVAAGADRPLAPAAATCRRCGARLPGLLVSCPDCALGPGRVWITSLVGGLVSAGVAWRLGASYVLVAYLLFVFLTVVLFLTDIDHKRIPNRITYPGTAAAALLLLAGSALDGRLSAFPRALAGAAAYSVFFLVVFLAARGGFGFGDVKLSVLLGLFGGYLGWNQLLVAGFLTAAVGGVMALAAVLLARAGPKTEIPYGPAMILGVWITIIGGPAVLDLFL